MVETCQSVATSRSARLENSVDATAERLKRCR
jgi:hypothetical protein